MTLTQFKNKYLGKQVEYHSFGSGALYQCVDLVNQYIVEVLGLTPIIGTNAKDFPTRYNKDEFDWIVNTPEAIIQEGDIPVWNSKVGGGAGHIAIAISGDINNFQSLDQNWSIKERVTIEKHNYQNVQGWLRAKVQPQNDTIPVKKTDFENLVRKSSAFDSVIQALDLPDDATQDTVLKSLAGTKGLIGTLQREKAELESEVSNQKEKCDNISNQKDRLIETKNTEIGRLNGVVNGYILKDEQHATITKNLEDALRAEQKAHGITKKTLAVCETGQPKVSCLSWLFSLIYKK